MRNRVYIVPTFVFGSWQQPANMTFAQLSLYCVAMFVLVLHLLLPLLERAAVAQLDGPAVVDGVVGSVHGAAAAAAAAAPVALVVFSFCLAARPARRRRRLAARPPDADSPPAANNALVPVNPLFVGGRGQHLVAAAPDQHRVDSLEGEREARLHREEPQAEGDRGHGPEARSPRVVHW